MQGTCGVSRWLYASGVGGCLSFSFLAIAFSAVSLLCCWGRTEGAKRLRPLGGADLPACIPVELEPACYMLFLHPSERYLVALDSRRQRLFIRRSVKNHVPGIFWLDDGGLSLLL